MYKQYTGRKCTRNKLEVYVQVVHGKCTGSTPMYRLLDKRRTQHSPERSRSKRALLSFLVPYKHSHSRLRDTSAVVVLINSSGLQYSVAPALTRNSYVYPSPRTYSAYDTIIQHALSFPKTYEGTQLNNSQTSTKALQAKVTMKHYRYHKPLTRTTLIT